MERRGKKRKAAVASEEPRCVVHDLPDDLLWQILLRLDSPIWLMRAACACKQWRRVVTDGADEGRTFLRLASSLHPPTVVGQYHNQSSGDIRFVPSSSPIDGSWFSVDFLDKNSRWHIADCHGGLVLLRTNYEPCRRSVPNLIVYDPLTRQQRPISGPAPLNDQVYNYGTKDTLLIHGEDGNISISNFRVLYRLNAATPDPHACVFSTANGGEWNWRFLSRSADENIFRHCYWYYMAGRATDGSLYLGLMMACGLGSRITALDNTSLVFSMVDLPIRQLDTASFSPSTFTVVHGPGVLGPSSPPRTSIVHVRGEELELFRQVHGSGEWVLEHSIPNLSEAARGLLVCPEKKKGVGWKTMVGHIADGAAFAILSAYTNMRWWFFSFDMNTMELRVLPQELYRDTSKMFNYTLPWPQYLRACPCS